MRVALFGLGEAGSLIAADLVEKGLDVHAYDPAPVPTPTGVIRQEDARLAVDGADFVLAITAGSDARSAIEQAVDAIHTGSTYADLSTSSPGSKRELSRIAEENGLSLADVALMATVPGRGFGVPALASGPGAEAYARFANENGGSVAIVSGFAGDAAAQKLLRSVVTKGLTSLLIESMRAAEAHGTSDWLWHHLAETLENADEALMSRLVDGTPLHLDRRLDEMQAAVEFLESLGVDPLMTRATVHSLNSVRAEGIPPRG